MKYVEEYRDPEPRRSSTPPASRRIVTRPWTIMEVCGGQTHAIVKYGIDELLPHEVTLVHGPGCPVCVTPVELIDKALESPRGRRSSSAPSATCCACRAHELELDLFSVKAAGGDVRIVYSPMDAVQIAAAESGRSRSCSSRLASRRPRPPTRWRCIRRSRSGITNFSVLVSHVLVPPAMEAILVRRPTRCRDFLPPDTSAR